MAIAGAKGGTREAGAVQALDGGALAGLQKRFQTWVYRIDRGVACVDKTAMLQPGAAATHLRERVKQGGCGDRRSAVGAIVLLSDGAENAGGIDADTLGALCDRRLPVHTIGFGRKRPTRDLEMEQTTSQESRWPTRA